jgi:hypothetical protein
MNILKRSAKEALYLCVGCFVMFAFLRVGTYGVSWLATGFFSAKMLITLALFWVVSTFAFYGLYGGFKTSKRDQ